MLKRILLGRPLPLKQQATQTVTKKEALALLSSDALSSVAYGPEQILIVLFAAGTMTFAMALSVGALIVALLLLLIFAYREVITLFPEGGGAYKVTQTYIGKNTALTTASLLLVDYILTIAVSVSAGVDALIAAFPVMTNWHIEVGVAFIIVLLLLNLRGVSETAKLLMLPVYSFIACLVVIFVIGILQWNNTTTISQAMTTSISWLVLIKAFAVGCSALTGVEAISNAVPNFKKPAVANARKTMLVLGCLLAMLFSGVLLLANHFAISPTSNSTVLSQLAQNIVGRNAFYFVFQTLTICILMLAANTSFAAFPQLLANLAKDGYAPRIFLNRGDRLRLF